MPPTSIADTPQTEHTLPPVLPADDTRGTYGMLLFVLTESFLFVFMFFAYYYVEKGNQRWHIEVPPRLHYALPQLGLLALGSLLLWWGEKQALQRKGLAARLAILGTIILGFGYLVLSYFSYSEHLQHISLHTDAYGSAFYTITGIHIAHLILGILMLFWVILLPHWEPMPRPPHRPYHNVAIYWHFVAALWLITVCILYIGPNVYNAL